MSGNVGREHHSRMIVIAPQLGEIEMQGQIGPTLAHSRRQSFHQTQGRAYPRSGRGQALGGLRQDFSAAVQVHQRPEHVPGRRGQIHGGQKFPDLATGLALQGIEERGLGGTVQPEIPGQPR